VILEEWKWRSRLSETVQSVDGDFDRFVNSVLCADLRQPRVLAKLSEQGRALDRYFVRKSFLAQPNGFASLATDPHGLATPFHEITAYLQHQKPVTFDGFLQIPRGDSTRYLARCSAIKADNLSYSVALCEGNVDLADCSSSLIVAGGNLAVRRSADLSLIITAGDVELSGQVNHVFVIAGGKVILDRRVHTQSVVIVSPRKVVLPPPGRFTRPLLVLDGKELPAPGLFVFRDCWADFGLDAVLDGGQVRIRKVKSDAAMPRLFDANDMILVQGRKNKIQSLGQFRRLLRLALDTGEFDFEIERAGKKMNIRAELKKKEP
jgi:hypothetical protein